MLLISSIFVYAQQDVTKFLGVPVDGSKSEMIQKLKAKGYTSSQHNKDILVGEFNGTNVEIEVVTNKNKVCRVVVLDANPTDEGAIKIRFNKLCEQFANNSKYISSIKSLEGYIISDDEDIASEMTINKKRYEALFYQKPDSVHIDALAKSVVMSKYTEEQFANPTEELRAEMINLIKQYTLYKPVWFKIVGFQRKYYIAMYYDNEYNRANGEDL